MALEPARAHLVGEREPEELAIERPFPGQAHLGGLAEHGALARPRPTSFERSASGACACAEDTMIATRTFRMMSGGSIHRPAS